jgi:hypothetical protein
METVDAVGNVVTLGLSLAVGILLLAPVRQRSEEVTR